MDINLVGSGSCSLLGLPRARARPRLGRASQTQDPPSPLPLPSAHLLSRGWRPRAPMAISRIHPLFLLLLLRSFALLPTQAAARGGHDLPGLFLPPLPFGEMSGLGARFDEAVVPFESLGAFPFAWKRCDSNELVIFGDSRSGSTFHFCVL